MDAKPEALLSQQIVDILRRPLFEDLSRADIVNLSNKAKILQYDRGAVVYAQGQEDLPPILVLSGLIKLSSTAPHGRECILHIIRPEALIDAGVLYYEIGIPYSATAIAQSKGLVFDRQLFLSLVQTNGKFANKILKLMSTRQRLFINKLASSQGRISVSCRVAAWLLHRSRMDSTDLLQLNVSREVMARLLGVTRESLSRELSRLNRLGYIALQRHSIELLDKDALQKIATS